MKRLALAIGAAVAVLFGAGCAQVPATKFTIAPKTGTLSLDSPKDIAFTNLTSSMNPDGSFNISIGSYSSKNSPDVIAAVAAENAAMAATFADLVKTLGPMLIKGAVLAAPAPHQQSTNDNLFRITPVP